MDRVACRCGACVVAVVLAGWLVCASDALASGRSAEWSLESVRGTASGLSAVSCTSPTACVAVGSYRSKPGPKNYLGFRSKFALAERWDGSRWSILPTVNPGGGAVTSLTGVSFSGVSCASPMACTAIGTSDGAALIERWNGARWSIEPTPQADSTTLMAVSCPLPTACVAVGGYANVVSDPLVEQWNGRGWSVQPTNMTGLLPMLNGVSCSSAADCTAVGDAGSPEAGNFPVAGRWDGNIWSFSWLPVPGGPYGNCEFCSGANFELTGASCASSSSCIAVGSDRSSNAGGTVAFVEGWDGTSWSVQPAPTMGNLVSVSCASASACMAFGSSGTALWNGSSWSTTPPTPGGVVSGVSCASATACMAVGSSNGKTLAERWDGSNWAITPTPTLSVCVVPDVRGKSQSRARRAIQAAHCALDRAEVPHKPKRQLGNHQRWELVAGHESPSPGSVEPFQTRIRLKLVYKAANV